MTILSNLSPIEWDLITRKPRTYMEFAYKNDAAGARKQLDADMAERNAREDDPLERYWWARPGANQRPIEFTYKPPEAR